MTYPAPSSPTYISAERLSRTLDLSRLALSDDEFYAFCIDNRHLKLERNADGTITVVSLTGGKTGEYNSELTTELTLWKRKHGGHTFDSSTGFRLPNGAVRSPDAAWVSSERWQNLSAEQQRKHPPLAPDFVVELMSESDDLREARQKMEEYIDNGVQLAWLINRTQAQVLIFRIDGTVEKVDGFEQSLSGEGVLEGFEFDLGLLK